MQLAQPAFHIAPLLLNEPDDADSVYSDTSAHMVPRTQTVPAESRNLSTRRLTVPALEAARSTQPVSARGAANPMAAAGTVRTSEP